MSNKVFENILLPIITRILQNDPSVGNLFRDPYERIIIADRNLEKFVLHHLVKKFGINGRIETDPHGNIREGDYCDPLESVIKELLERDPEGLERELQMVLRLYIKLGLFEEKSQRSMPSPYFRTPEERLRERKPREQVKVV